MKKILKAKIKSPWVPTTQGLVIQKTILTTPPYGAPFKDLAHSFTFKKCRLGQSGYFSGKWYGA